MLVAEQELSIRCVSTGLEADARVLGQLEKAGETYSYVVRFLNANSDIWGIVFPEPAVGSGVISCVLLECNGCKSREVVYLDHFELELLETNRHLSRNCQRCCDASLWSKSQGEKPQLQHARPSAPAARNERRREPRRGLRIKACIRSPRLGEDVVTTRNTSRHGLSFTSPCGIRPGRDH